jgi:hypothetical protein
MKNFTQQVAPPFTTHPSFLIALLRALSAWPV